MTTEELARVWVPVPLRWRHVRTGDVFVSPGGDLWHVRSTNSLGRAVVSADCGDQNYASPVDPDDVINVLVPTTEADAVGLTIEQLGARLLERREATVAEQAALEQG
jgi:hypothetical protein